MKKGASHDKVANAGGMREWLNEQIANLWASKRALWVRVPLPPKLNFAKFRREAKRLRASRVGVEQRSDAERARETASWCPDRAERRESRASPTPSEIELREISSLFEFGTKFEPTFLRNGQFQVTKKEVTTNNTRKLRSHPKNMGISILRGDSHSKSLLGNILKPIIVPKSIPTPKSIGISGNSYLSMSMSSPTMPGPNMNRARKPIP